MGIKLRNILIFLVQYLEFTLIQPPIRIGSVSLKLAKAHLFCIGINFRLFQKKPEQNKNSRDWVLGRYIIHRQVPYMDMQKWIWNGWVHNLVLTNNEREFIKEHI